WAFLRGEQGSSLAGSLLALRVFDCNLLLDYDVLLELPHNIDLTLYVKIPVLPSQFTHYTEDEAEVEREKTFQDVLDQKHYIEEQNLQLTATLTNVRRKLSENRSIDSTTGITQKIDELNEKLEEERNQRLDAVERYALKRDEWKKALDDQELIRTQCGEVIKKIKSNIVERNRHFLSCMKNVEASVDLTFIDYDKRAKALESKLQTIHEEFHKKSTHPKKEFYDLMIKMEDKQGALAEVIKENEALYEKVRALEKQSNAAQNAIQELAELRLAHTQQSQKLQETEQALADLGPHLSDSKLQVVTMKEQLLPSTEWVKDSEHHCRRCGQIFCDSCSNHRVNLPSHAKQVRVCSRCLRFLNSLNKESTVSLS
uniref:FYVE-type domain-containing protein n=1 Tax=Panagrolaimus sp. PS1159 TaxID=55785 RepID=A0AC35GNC4_9BILA